MALHLLDTNILIHVLRGEERCVSLVMRLVDAGHTLATCGVVVAEVYAGMRAKDAEKTRLLVSSLEWLELSQAGAERAGLMRRDSSAKGVSLSLADCLIASIGIESQAILVTENVKDFPAKELLVLAV